MVLQTQPPVLDATPHRDALALLRQGELLFLPRPWLKIDANLVLRDEPVGRAVCEFACRHDGRVYVMGHLVHPQHETIRLPYWHQVTGTTPM